MLFSNVLESMIVMNCGWVFLGRRIIDPSSFGSRCIKETEESFPRADSSVYLIHRDQSDLGSIIRFRISPKNLPCILTHAFPGMFLKSFKKLAAHVLSGLKPLGCVSWF